jgi:hypothetical protein
VDGQRKVIHGASDLLRAEQLHRSDAYPESIQRGVDTLVHLVLAMWVEVDGQALSILSRLHESDQVVELLVTVLVGRAPVPT